MSAFIVSGDTMNRVLAAIRKRGYWSGQSVQADQHLQRIAADLFAMNARAMAARYGCQDEPPHHEYRPAFPTDIEMYKALRCLIHQCSEGNVPDEPLYRELEAVASCLAAEIIARLPAYQRAPWD
jgi:hypothetical protein